MRSQSSRSSARSAPTRRSAVPRAAAARICSWMARAATRSTPRVGCATTSTSGSRASARARTIFCWLPPERVRAGARRSGGRMSNRTMRASATPATARVVHEACAREPRELAQHQVVLDRRVEHEPLGLAVLVHHLDRARTTTSPPSGRRRPPSTRTSSRLPVAQHAGDPDDLPRAHLERNAPQRAPAPEVAQHEPRRRPVRRHPPLLPKLAPLSPLAPAQLRERLATDELPREPGDVCAAHYGAGPERLATTHDGDDVGVRVDLVELVRDDDDPSPPPESRPSAAASRRARRPRPASGRRWARRG